MLTSRVTPGRWAGGAASESASCMAPGLAAGLLVLVVRPLAPGEGARRESHVRVSSPWSQHCVLRERVTEEGPLLGREVGLSLPHRGAADLRELPPGHGAAPLGGGPGVLSPLSLSARAVHSLGSIGMSPGFSMSCDFGADVRRLFCRHGFCVDDLV